jgi:hypothetical protein
VEGAGAHFEVERLDQHAALLGPIIVEFWMSCWKVSTVMGVVRHIQSNRMERAR